MQRPLPPNCTFTTEENPFPKTVTLVPPAVRPNVGVILVRTGATVYVNVAPLLVPPDVVTVTLTAPVPAGEVTRIWDADTTLTLVPGVLPNDTVAPATKPVPVMVTAVVPAAGPLAGDREVIVGTCENVAALLVPPDVVTVTLTAPAPAGEVTVISVADTTVTLVPALPPNDTVAPGTKPVPVMVTAVAPAAGPLVGESMVIVGGAAAATQTLFVQLPPPEQAGQQ